MPTLGSKSFSISSALVFVKLKPDPCGAFTITKKAPRSSGAINSFGAKLNKKIVKANVLTKKYVIILLVYLYVFYLFLLLCLWRLLLWLIRVWLRIIPNRMAIP